jgi:predicted amidohydrolase
MSKRYLAAAVQMEPRLGEKEYNVALLSARALEAARAGARIIVLPEMAVTGYCFRDRAEVTPLVEAIPGPITGRFVEIAVRHGCYIAVGLAERDPTTDLYYNTAALVGPDGVVAAYRKSHAFISEPRWAAESTNQPPVVATPFGRLGLLICMDADYMEPARLLGVAGCEVALFPTCWLDEKAPASAWMARAYENGMYFVAADRYGLERSVQFSGGSCILDPDGEVVAMQDSGEGIVYGEIDLERTRRRTFAAGTADDKLVDRRPNAYTSLALHTYLWNPLDFHRLYGENTLPEGDRTRVAAVQWTPSRDHGAVQQLDDVTLEGLRTPIRTAAADGATLVVLPALPLLTRAPRTADEAASIAESLDGATARHLSAMAGDLGIHLVGSLIEREADRLYLTVILVGPDGLVGRYRYIHPSRKERAWATPGHELPVFDLPTMRVGLLFGRDALLPEPARVLALHGADVICAPATVHEPAPRGLPASEVPFVDERQRAANPVHFHLWRQRATENNTVVAFANRGAPDGMGYSGVFGPEVGGEHALVAGDRTGIAILEVDTTSRSPGVATAPVRIKDLLRKRVPAMYAPLVTPGYTESVTAHYNAEVPVHATTLV